MKRHTRIMIVDDELLLRNGLRYLLDWESHGFQIVAEASNGEDALILAGQTQPDILITDIVMPRMNGIDMTRQIKARFPQMHIIILSSYDSFDYAKSLFKLGIADYLLKPALNQEDLLALLNRLSHTAANTAGFSLAEQYIKEILYRTTFSHEQCLDGFRARGVAFGDGAAFMLLCGKPRGTAFGMLNRLLNALPVIFPEECSAGCISDENRLLVLLQLNGGADAPLKSLAAYLAAHEPDAVFSRSAYFMDLGALPALYKSCCDILSYSFYDPERAVLAREDIEKACPLPLTDRVNGKQDQPAGFYHDVLTGYIVSAAACMSPEPYALKLHIKDVLFRLFESLSGKGESYESILAQKIILFKRISLAAHAQELCRILDELFAQISAQAQSIKGGAGQMLINQIKAYLQVNYARDLKLSDVAKAFHVSYSHCSHLFYKYTGVHFSDYLTQLRVEKAMQLLRTGLSIQEVSEQAGFVNQSYFARIFKSSQGISPKQYQKMRC